MNNIVLDKGGKRFKVAQAIINNYYPLLLSPITIEQCQCPDNLFAGIKSEPTKEMAWASWCFVQTNFYSWGFYVTARNPPTARKPRISQISYNMIHYFYKKTTYHQYACMNIVCNVPIVARFWRQQRKKLSEDLTLSGPITW